MKRIAYLFYILLLLPVPADAQQKHTFIIKDGKLVQETPPAGDSAAGQGRNVALNQEQQWMFAALSFMMQKDYARAEDLYSQIINHNSGNAEAYLQRGVARRELKKTRDMEGDARMAFSLFSRQIKEKPQDADLYYSRSMALRLLKEFDLAKKDLLTAIDLKGTSNLTYQNDLQAIELERRMAVSAQ